LTRRVPLVEQELHTLPEHLSSTPVFSGFRVTRSLVLYVCFVDRCLSFCIFSFGHCVLLYTDSDCPFGIFKLFLYKKYILIPSWFAKQKKDKQRSTKHTYKTKDRVTRNPLKTGVELRCSGRVCSSCSTSGTRRVNLVTNPVISCE
jgi:hypothetical protein